MRTLQTARPLARDQGNRMPARPGNYDLEPFSITGARAILIEMAGTSPLVSGTVCA
jgi:hypothetical protein